MLFPYSRAFIYAREYGGRLLPPTWRNVKLGPYLRREPDKRTYGELFHHRRPTDFARIARARFLPGHGRLSEARFQAEGAPQDRPALVEVSGQGDNFAPLCGHEADLRTQFLSMLRVPLTDKPNEIAVHVRMGDFAEADSNGYSRNTRLPLDWYGEEISRIRSETGLREVAIFTDDGTGAVERHFAALGEAHVVTPVNAATDILRLATSAHIVCSNSTFSLWAAFLSNGSFSTRSPELFSDYGFGTEQMARCRS